MADKKSKDPYTSRNEFKKDFYKQKDKPPVTAETMHGTGTTRQLDESIMSPDDSMLVEYKQKGGKIKTKKAFMGLAVEALKGGKGLGPLIGMGADKLLKRSQTIRDVTGKLGIGGKLISNYYNDKASDKRNAQAPKEEVTFNRLQNGGSVMVKTKLGKNKATKLY
jgi:uncharacterized membrane protein YebE (DUF533 family)